MSDDIKKCWSVNEEEYNYDSLEDLLDSNEQLVEGNVVHFADAIAPDAASLIDADDVITMIGERAHDMAGEWADDFPDVSKEAEAELDQLLRTWIEKHCIPTFYTVENVRPYTITEEDLKASHE